MSKDKLKIRCGNFNLTVDSVLPKSRYNNAETIDTHLVADLVAKSGVYGIGVGQVEAVMRMMQDQGWRIVRP